jgi:hypothetical protein
MPKNQETPKAETNDEPTVEVRTGNEETPRNVADDLADPNVTTEDALPEGDVEDTTTVTTPGETDKERKADEHARLLAAEAAAPTGLTNDEIAAKAMPTVDKVRLTKIQQLFGLMNDLDLLEKVDNESAEPEKPVIEKSQTGDGDIAAVVRKAVEDATVELRTRLEQTDARLQEVLGNTPEGSAPALLSKSEADNETIEEFQREFDKLPQYEKLRYALMLAHEAKG